MRPASIMAFAVAFLAISAVADKAAMFVGLSLGSRDKPRSEYNVTRLSGETWSLGASGGFSFVGVSIPLLNDVRPSPLH